MTPHHDRLFIGTADQQLHVWRVKASGPCVATPSGVDSAAFRDSNPGDEGVGSVFVAMGTISRQTHERVASVRCSGDGIYVGVQVRC